MKASMFSLPQTIIYLAEVIYSERMVSSERKTFHLQRAEEGWGRRSTAGGAKRRGGSRRRVVIAGSSSNMDKYVRACRSASGPLSGKGIMWDSLCGISSFEVGINGLGEGHGNGQSILGCQGHRAGTARCPWERQEAQSRRFWLLTQLHGQSSGDRSSEIREIPSCTSAFFFFLG